MPTTTIELTITTPTGTTIASVMDVLCNYWGYQPIVEGAPNPETKAAFVKRQITAFLRSAYKIARSEAAAVAARSAEMGEADLMTVT